MKKIFSILVALCCFCPSLALAVGQVRIERQGENTTSGINSAPFAAAWVDALAPSTTNPITFTSITAGFHTAKVTAIHGLPSVSAGTCVYAVGGGECTVSTFNLTPTCNYTTGECTQTVTVTDNNVTKIAFKFQSSYVGFGATIGGRDGTIIEVTNLNNTGAGSFRQALLTACAAHNRYIVFRVSGTISGGASSGAYAACGHDITVDGFTAPGGVTIQGNGIVFVQWGAGFVESDHKNYIVRGLRFDMQNNLDVDTAISFDPGSSYTGPNRSHHVVIDHNTITGSHDDQIGLGREVHDITVSWNMIHTPSSALQNMIVIGFVYNVSIHHNFYAPNSWRNPLIKHYPNGGSVAAPNLTADFRNNFILYGDRPPGSCATCGTLNGTSVATMAKANIIKNYYVAAPEAAENIQGMSRAIDVCTPTGSPVGTNKCGGFSSSAGIWITDADTAAGGVWLDGNQVKSAYHAPLAFDHNNLDYLASSAFTAPTINETTAEVAACAVLLGAGVLPRNSVENAWVTKGQIELAKFHDCGGSTPAVEAQLSNGSPTGILAAGTTTATLQVTSNVAATCKYGTVAGTAYASIASTFTTTGGTAHSQNLTGLTAGVYTYYVRCSTTVGAVANTSDFVISFSIATAPGGSAPANPSGFTLVRSTTDNAIIATWNDNSTNEDNFDLWGSIAGKWGRVALLPADTTTYTTTVLSPGAIYCQNVQAINAVGWSDFSDQPADCVTAPPLKVLSASATDAATGGKVNHQWQFPTLDAGGILILRRASSACTDRPVDGTTYTVGNTIGSCTVTFVGTTQTTFSDTGLTSATTYHYAYFTKSVTGSRYAATVSTSATPTGPGVPAAPTGLGIGGDRAEHSIHFPVLGRALAKVIPILAP